jgi:hypothetical protein
MKYELPRCAFLATLTIFLWATAGHAVSVTDYRTYRASPATTLTGQGTDDPVVGDLSNTANSSFVIGYLPASVVLGANTGDSVTFSFGVSFNDATGISNSGDNFRFAIFDLNGEAADPSTPSPNYATAGTNNTDDFRGYWFGVKNGTGTGSGGSIRERTGTLLSGQNAFAATGANLPTAPSLGAVGGDPVTLTSDVNGNAAGAHYTGVLKLTRNGSGLIDLSGSFLGSNAATGNVFSASDTTANGSSTYGAIGFLIGNALNVDQATFTDITVTSFVNMAGDYNGNGVVDAADYAVWRKNAGGAGGSASVGDSEPDGDVDNDDYTFWRSRFGNGGPGAGSSLGTSNVPEPASTVLILMVAGMMLIAAHRRARMVLEPVRGMPSR